MASKNVILNGYTTVPAPDSFEPAIRDLDKTAERSASSLLFRDRVATKRSYDIGWTKLDDTQIAAILTAIKPEFFPATIPDAETGTYSGTFYTGDRKTPLNPDGTWKLSFTITER
jgi:hypothetical protein